MGPITEHGFIINVIENKFSKAIDGAGRFFRNRVPSDSPSIYNDNYMETNSSTSNKIIKNNYRLGK